MSELSKIQPTQRIPPPVQDHQTGGKKQKQERQKKPDRPEHGEQKDRKVDEYI